MLPFKVAAKLQRCRVMDVMVQKGHELLYQPAPTLSFFTDGAPFHMTFLYPLCCPHNPDAIKK